MIKAANHLFAATLYALIKGWTYSHHSLLNLSHNPLDVREISGENTGMTTKKPGCSRRPGFPILSTPLEPSQPYSSTNVPMFFPFPQIILVSEQCVYYLYRFVTMIFNFTVGTENRFALRIGFLYTTMSVLIGTNLYVAISPRKQVLITPLNPLHLTCLPKLLSFYPPIK
jgi:hypothetical protein